MVDAETDELDLDRESQMELVLASYPESLAEQCRAQSPEFIQAFLLAHEGRDEEALSAYEQVAAGQRYELFYLERGALLARIGQVKSARKDLGKAMDLNAKFPLLRETLISIEIGSGEFDRAEALLNAYLKEGESDAYCYARLAEISMAKGRHGAALEMARKSLELGEKDPSTVMLVSALLEKDGALDEAEKVLSRLSGGGCGGPVNIPLAEFWVRHGRQSNKALDMFKKALRQEPANPRWLYRIGQVYLQKGWVKEGEPMIKKALSADGLQPELRSEAETLLRNLR